MYLILCILFSSYVAADIGIDSENIESISHYRALPIHLDDPSRNDFVRHAIEDKQSYIWRSGNRGLERYDAYTLKLFEFESLNDGVNIQDPFMFIDSEGNLWSSGTGLRKFDYKSDTFVTKDIDVEQRIQTIIEDKDGFFWLSVNGVGIVQYDPKTEHVIERIEQAPRESQNNDAFPKFVFSMAYHSHDHKIWMASRQGLFVFDIRSKSIKEVPTALSTLFPALIIRDIAIDIQGNELWLGTPEGLLQLNTTNYEYTIHSIENHSLGLPTSDITTVLIDSRNNLWIGTEKKGLCLYKRSETRFLCMQASSDDRSKLPMATVEDIYEGSNGNLWVSMNAYGLYRITPHLEKFRRLRNQISHPISEYFPNSFEGVVLEDQDIWIATDGGGINIFNYRTGKFSTLKKDPFDDNSLSSDAVISIAQGPSGYVWAATWGGGISRIDPNTGDVKRIEYDPSKEANETLLANNIFHILPDQNGGIWISVWGVGLQYYDTKTQRFTNFVHKEQGGDVDITNFGITDMQLFEGKLYIAGHQGLEYLDINTSSFVPLLTQNISALNHVLVTSHNEIWLASVDGLIKFNAENNATKIYTEEQGLSDNSINYLFIDRFNKLWVASAHGVSMMNIDNDSIVNFFEKDGLVANQTSSHGEFFMVDDDLFIPNKYGMNIINITDIPPLVTPSNTVLSKPTLFDSKGNSKVALHRQAQGELSNTYSYNFNSILFEFSSLNYVFPQHNRYKYRLNGWQQNYIETSSLERFARFNNLPPGEYTFEVISANSSGIWDTSPATFAFKIAPAWWQTWWARLLFVVSFLLISYSFALWRLAVGKEREKILSDTVEEKTKQLKEYATKLELSSQSLIQLNAELEQRVEKRTGELQIEINEREVAQKKLYQMAFHDALTSLPNREWLIKKLNNLIQPASIASKKAFGLMFLDGDRFKLINDNHGHSIGDELLIACAMRLSKLVGPNNHVVRLGGDEFTIVLEHVNEQSELESIANSIIEAFKKPFTFENLVIHFQMSVGALLCNSQHKTVTGVLRDADIAMYHAKKSGKGTYKLFDHKMRNEVIEFSELEADLHKAIENNEFYLVYQPIIDIQTNQVVNLEVLLRWEHPEKGNISPAVFIPIAEETGHIVCIGEWVLRRACEQLKQWQLFDNLNSVGISVNISSNQIQRDDFISMFDKVEQDTGLHAKFLKLEITETTLVENNEDIKFKLEHLVNKGIDLAIDDFGTGYSSLAYLNRLPAQYLKIDRHFIEAIDNTPDGSVNQDALAVVKATVSLGHSLGMKVTAEGIETLIELEELQKINADFAQGFFISRPLRAEKVIDFINAPISFDKKRKTNILEKHKEKKAVKDFRLKKN